MSDQVYIEFNANLLRDHLGHFIPDAVRQETGNAVEYLTNRLLELVEQNLQGGVLQERSGKLANSFTSSLSIEGDLIIGSVNSSGIVYDRILEEGGHTAAHSIYPVNAKTLAFATASADVMSLVPGLTAYNMVYAAHVNHPGSKMPAFHYLLQAVVQLQAEAPDIFDKYIGDEFADEDEG